MGFNVLRLAFAAFWAVVAVWAFFPNAFAPAGHSAFADNPNTQLFGLLAIAFVVWNLTRWAVARQRGREARLDPRAAFPLFGIFGLVLSTVFPRREPGRREFAKQVFPNRRRQADRPEEYHPEFDFGAADRQPPPNGG